MSSPTLDCWHPRTETMARPDLAAWQWRKLRSALDHAQRSPFWRTRLPAGITSIEDFVARTPLLFKEDLIKAQQADPPYGDLPSSDPAQAMRHHQTSGTSGNPPFRTFDTKRDWAWTVDMWCTALHAFGVRPGQKGMVAFGYGLFMGFWGMQCALERMGCTVVPAGGMDSRSRIQLMIDHEIEVIGCTPSYAVRLIHTAREMGVDLAAETALHTVVTAAEPRPASVAHLIATSFGAKSHDCAGMTELGTLFHFECPEQAGNGHIIETGVLEEVLHPETQQPVGYGEQGVRVMTALGREGIQVFRYWTGDLVVRRPAHECTCGRTWDWYDGGVLGRVDDVRKVRGISVSPMMIEDVVRGFAEVDEFQAHLRSIRGLDTIVLRVEPNPTVVLADGVDDTLCARIAERMKQDIGLRPAMELAAVGSLPRFEGKAARFHDERQQ